MIINRYFENFPIITYSNNQVVDITKRVTVLDSASKNPYVFYPFEITQGERPDQLSFRYYEDPFKSWMLYLSNKMVDPYHEWYMEPLELENFIEKKYGDLFLSRIKVKYYQNDYTNSEQINVSEWNALPQELKKYWKPIFGNMNKTVAYERKPLDWTVNTNKIVSYTVNNANNFIKDELCDIVYDTLVKGRAQVLTIDGNTVYMQHVSNQYFTTNTVTITSNSYIYGLESETNTVFTQFNYVANTIPAAEETYWKAITYFDYENNRNEYNKTIIVLDKSYAKTMSKNLKDLLKE